MSKPTRSLPTRPSLEQLRKQAKELLREFRAGDETAGQRFGAVNPRFLINEVSLADAQFVLANEYGFESWAKLVHHIETIRPVGVREYEDLVQELATAYSSGDFTAIREINWTYATSYVWDRELTRMQERLPTWYASANRTMALALADARRLVARQSGFDNWDDLVRSLAQSSANKAAGPGGSPSRSPFYRVDQEKRTIETHGPVSQSDWDVVFGVMKEMQLTGLKAGGQMTDAALERLSALDHVTHLDIGGSKRVTDNGLRHIARLARLEDLALGGWDSPITDRGLEVLRRLCDLRRFGIGWHQRVSDAGIANLSGCEQLESVNLMGTPTGNGALAALAGKRRLCRLKAGARVSQDGLAVLHEIPMFKTWQSGDMSYALMGAEVGPTFLLLPQRPFATGGLDAMIGLDGLFGLNFFRMGESGGQAMTGAGVKPLLELGNLGWLGCDPGDDAMTCIGAMPRLRMLSCQDTGAGDDGFVALSRSRTLEYIWGRDTRNLTGRGFLAIATMPSLRGLATSLKHVEDAALSALPQFPGLRELMPMGLTDDAFRHVGRCEQLQALWLMYCRDTGDRATEHIARLPALKSYYAGSTRITDMSLGLLGSMLSLEEVTLEDCPAITDVGIAKLAALPQLRKVTLESVPGVSRVGTAVFPSSVRVAYLA